VTRHPGSPTWPLETLSTTNFAEQGGRTTVTIRWVSHYAAEEERNTFDSAFDGMRQGLQGTLDNLDEYLAQAQERNAA
jgi:hypothetical protein